MNQCRPWPSAFMESLIMGPSSGESISTTTSTTTATEISTAATSVFSLPSIFTVQKLFVSPNMPMEENIQAIWIRQIRSRLSAELLHSISKGTCVQEFMMVGKRPDTLKPTLLITCGDAATKKKVEKTFKSQGWLRELLKVNRIMFIALVAKTPLSAGPASIDSSEMKLSESYAVQHLPSGVTTSCGLGLQISSADNSVQQHCTLGGLLLINGEIMGLTAGHPFPKFKHDLIQQEFLEAAQVKDDSSDEECSTTSSEPFIFNDNDNVDASDDFAAFTVSLHENADIPLASIDGPLHRQHIALGSFLPSIKENLSVDVILPISTPKNIMSVESPHNFHDWALLQTLPLSVKSQPNKIAHINPRHDILIEGTADSSACGEVTIAIAGIGPRLGYLHSSSATMKVNESVLDVRLLTLERVLPLGSSGAWVILGKQLCGYIVAVRQDIPWAYMVAIGPVLEDIREKLETDDVRLPTAAEIFNASNVDYNILEEESRTLSEGDQIGISGEGSKKRWEPQELLSTKDRNLPVEVPSVTDLLVEVPSTADLPVGFPGKSVNQMCHLSERQEDKALNANPFSIDGKPHTSVVQPSLPPGELSSKKNGSRVSTSSRVARVPDYHAPLPLHRQPIVPSGYNGAPPLYSKYDQVEALLLQWEDDDLGVNTEIQKLDRLFRSHFNFTTYLRRIPSKDADDYLTSAIVHFRKGKSFRDLLIVYYGGHAAGSIWVANRTPTSPTLDWLSVQGLLLEYSADVLLIFDCRFTTHAARGLSVGDNWFLGATAKDSSTTGVSWKSFTGALIQELERRAESHKANGHPFTVQSIHNDLTLFHRDLGVTPVITRLTDHDCEATDLTPLPSHRLLRLNSSPFAPLPPLPSRRLAPHLPQRPRVRLMIPSIPGRDPAKNLPVPDSIVDLLRDKSFSVRLSDLPTSYTVNDIRSWVSDRLGHETRISRIGPSSAVMTFSSAACAKQALKINNCHFRTQTGEEAMIRLDNDFLGLSCLYSSTKSSVKDSTLDLVFIHGINGHAINSFASHLIDPIREAMWPCSELPKVLEEAGIFPRIMTFGWDANVWLDPHQDNQKLGEACESLRRELDRERSDCKNRPIVFVGYGVGGLLVKQVVLEIINFAFNDGFFENPIKACFFFGVPHHSFDEGMSFASIRAAMNFLVRRNEFPDFSQIESLNFQNQAIGLLSQEFDVVRKQYGIHTHCIYGRQLTGSMYVVPEESAMLDRNPENSDRVDANFRNIVQLARSERNRWQVLGIMRDIIQKKLNPKPAPKHKMNKESLYARLKERDIVYLIDDSDSMAGPRWSTTSKVLAKIATITAFYNKDGIDVRFFNTYSEDEERVNLNSSEKVMRLFRSVTPDGGTPTADILEDELSQYLAKFRVKRNRKKLYLIVLTDGQPDDVQAVEEVVIKYANELEELKAPPFQVGMQFVQIGEDKVASEFLRRLNDDLMKKRCLNRDMVDTVLWKDDDEEWLYEKILFEGILKRLDDDNGH